MSDIQDHPEYRGLLAAVKAAPDDDLPRLVLADWLEEHDSPDWAEFIRSQCMLDRFPHAARIRADTYTDAEGVLPDWQQPLTAARRAFELWPTVARTIFDDLATEGEVAWFSSTGQCRFGDEWSPELMYVARRGFLDFVICHFRTWVADQWRPLGPLIVSRQPVREVVFGDLTDHDRGITTWSAVAGDDTFRQDPYRPERLPWCIARQLTGYSRRTEEATVSPPQQAWVYPDSKQAAEALSRAAIAWAEEEAGL